MRAPLLLRRLQLLSALPATRIFSCRCFRCCCCCCCCCFQGRCGCTSPSACRGPAELRRRRGRSTSVVGRRCCRFPSRCSRLRSRCIRLPTFCYADEWQVVAPLRPRACSVEYRDELYLPVNCRRFAAMPGRCMLPALRARLLQTYRDRWISRDGLTVRAVSGHRIASLPCARI